MGFLGEIRKLLFGVKSVSKSAANKVVDKGRDVGEDILDKSADFFDNAKEVAIDTGEDIMDGIGNIKDKVTGAGKSAGSKVGNMASKAADSAKKAGQKIAKNPVVEKAADISEKVGAKVLDVGEDLVEKGKDVSEKVGEQVLKAKDKIVKKAKEITADLGEKLDATIEKAEKMAAEEKANPTPEFAETPLDASGSLLDGKDDFFSKAAAYSEGDHGAFSEGKIEITTPTPDPVVKEIKAAGFTDLDGDGDEITDDAIVIESSSEELEPVVENIADDVSATAETISDNITEDVAQVEAPDMDVNIEEIIDPAGEGDSDPPEKDA